MKFPAEITKHDPMDIRAFSANPHTVNHPPKHTSASFHQQVMLMSGQNDCHLPTSLHHIQNICTIQEMLTVSLPFATNDCCLKCSQSCNTISHKCAPVIFKKSPMHVLSTDCFYRTFNRKQLQDPVYQAMCQNHNSEGKFRMV